MGSFFQARGLNVAMSQFKNLNLPHLDDLISRLYEVRKHDEERHAGFNVRHDSNTPVRENPAGRQLFKLTL